MRKNLMSSLVLGVVLATSLSSCAVFQGRETTGQYIDDSAITTAVKAAILDDPQLKMGQIHVETLRGVVQLSGFVSSAHARDHAAQVARRVDGVLDVKNSLVVR
jgi:hyperosmotically inducible protein